ncbi:glycosyltransferase, partial [bacterium]|nr:glycosyltransferase [bacterium]
LFTICLLRRKKSATDNKPLVSVVIAARNEEQNIKNCLLDLAVQTYPEDLFEIIVVNDNSEDNTSNIIKEFQQKINNLHLIEINRQIENFSPKKYALSEGIKISRGEIILTTDADCSLKPSWIEYMVKNFTPACGMVIGFSYTSEINTVGSICRGIQALDFLSLMTAAAGTSELSVPLAASGQNLAYRKTAFTDVGGFEKIKDRISGDDTLLLQTIKKYTPYKIRFSFYKESFVSSPPLHSLKAFFNQRIRWASNAAFLRKTDIPFLLYLTNTFILNLLLLILVPLSVFPGYQGLIPLYCLICKCIIDFIVLFSGAKIFERMNDLKYFPLWELFQPPYITLTGIFGTAGKFTWKGRKY